MLLANGLGKKGDQVAAPDDLNQSANGVGFDDDGRRNLLRSQVVIDMRYAADYLTRSPPLPAKQETSPNLRFISSAHQTTSRAIVEPAPSTTPAQR
jgi:hypothetical protein